MHSEVVLVQNGGVGPGCNPAAGSARWNRDADKKNRIATRARNLSICEVSAKLGIAVRVQRHCVRVEHSLIASAGVADQRACDRGDRPGGSR